MGNKPQIGENVTIKPGVILEDDVYIGDGCYLDYNCIIRSGTALGKQCYVGAGCILGELNKEFFEDFTPQLIPLTIGDHAIIRSYSIIYGGTEIGDHFQTGHRVTIREQSKIGHHVNIGTLGDVQGYCSIGNYVHTHSNVHISQTSTIADYVWLFPNVVFTNDPTPPSDQIVGVNIEKFAAVGAGAILLPGITIGEDALVAAGATVTKDVPASTIVAGSPGKSQGPTSKIKNKFTGEQVYPWRYTFSRGMPWQDIGYDAFEKQEQET